MEFVTRTHIGQVRSANQDSAVAFVHAGFLIGIVADGMGGHNGGAEASRMAIACVKAYLLSHLHATDDADALKVHLNAAYARTNKEILNKALTGAAYSGMGTTLTVALLKDGELFVSNVGDSRAYIVDRKQLSQITVDQTWVQRLIENGEITQEEAKTHPYRHVIMQAVGTEENVRAEMYTAKLTEGETVLLCSDGCSGEVDEVQLTEILLATSDLDAKAEALIAAANAAGGADNITVVLLRR